MQCLCSRHKLRYLYRTSKPQPLIVVTTDDSFSLGYNIVSKASALLEITSSIIWSFWFAQKYAITQVLYILNISVHDYRNANVIARTAQHLSTCRMHHRTTAPPPFHGEQSTPTLTFNQPFIPSSFNVPPQKTSCHGKGGLQTLGCHCAAGRS